jgi:hypothetical protein
MSETVYEAALHTQEITYKNFKGETKTAELSFALDPLNLLQVMSGYTPKKVKSGNPALNGKDAEISDDEQIKMIRRLAVMAAGTPSDDGDSWYPFEGFETSIAGKAFLTKLVTSDEDRRQFSEVAILAPFRAFCAYFDADSGNSAQEKKEMKDMLTKMERVFRVPDPGSESAEERRERLERELAAIRDTAAE